MAKHKKLNMILPPKKKSRKMDPKLLAKDKHEINYIAKRYKVKVGDVKLARTKVGRSRAKVYAELREMGYTINTKK